MARIRTVKPEFWTDELVGTLPHIARLLFIATWNLADDEGLLRWSAPYLKGAVFPFDDSVTVVDVQANMEWLTKAGVIFDYRGGRSQQQLAYVVNFRKHQKINRPSPSRLPPPPYTELRVREMYAARDEWRCHLCGFLMEGAPQLDGYCSGSGDFFCSADHVTPRSLGGHDYPSNIRASHATCNKARCNRTIEHYRKYLQTHPKRLPDALMEHSLNHSVTEGERELDRDLEPASDDEGFN